MIKVQSPDWPTCIKKLENAGMSQRQIAKKVKVGAGTINRLRNNPNHQPLYSTGEAILMCLGEID